MSVDESHSGLGIASFVISMIAAIAIFLSILVAVFLESSTPGGVDEESRAAILVGTSIVVFLAGSLVALLLGIAGLFQRDRIRFFAVVGILISAITILGTAGLLLAGMAVG